MAYCINCGQQLADGAKFCAECGTSVNEANQSTQRKAVYDGEIHKCPNCGEVLDSFVSNCPACGYELRGTEATSAVRELAAKLEAIESERETIRHNPLKSLYFGQEITKTDEQKISLIRSFSIPNTKEDLYEFLILSESNIDIDLYDDDGNQFKKNDARRAVSDAWKAKFEQAYQKAKIIFANDPRLNEIQSLYDRTQKSISKAKWKTWKLVGILWGVILAVLAIIFIFDFAFISNDQKKEIARLESIEEKIEIALQDGDYKYALMNADSLVFSGSDTDLERGWEIKRNYWIDKVIEEGAKNGITLERPSDRLPNEEEHPSTADAPSQDGFVDDSDNTTEDIQSESEENIEDTSPAVSKETLERFINGYETVEFNKYNSPASENGLEDSRIYFYCTLDRIEILEANDTTSILGYVTDDTDNEWLIQLHFVPAVSKTAFDSYVGEELVLRGVYSGFSGTKEMPVVVLDEMIVLSTGENVMGMQKLLDE